VGFRRRDRPLALDQTRVAADRQLLPSAEPLNKHRATSCLRPANLLHSRSEPTAWTRIASTASEFGTGSNGEHDDSGTPIIMRRHARPGTRGYTRMRHRLQ
jgi:hypothetical protein